MSLRARLGLACLVATPHIALANPGAPPAPADQPVKKALILGVDGLRADLLRLGRAPAVQRLMDEGGYTEEMRTGPVTVSGPGWSNALCGVWMDKHGCKDNKFEGVDYGRYPHLFLRARQRLPEAKLCHYIGWAPIDEQILGDGPADERRRNTGDAAGDRASAEQAIAAIEAGRMDLGFLYFHHLDDMGHAHGFHASVPEYVAQWEVIDGHIGRVMDAIRRRDPAREDWLVLLVTDHGGTIDGGHGRDIDEHRIVPMVAWGRGVARGRWLETVNQVDVAPTVLAHLGVAIDPAWDYDGRVVGRVAARRIGDNLIVNAGAEQGLGRDAVLPDRGIPGWTDTGSATVLRYGAPGGYATPASPGSAGRGANFFVGGKAKEARIEQVVGFAEHGTRIDQGEVQVEVSGWFGGFADQRDLCWLELEWMDADLRVLGRAALPAASVGDRRAAFGGEKDSWTGMLQRQASFAPPTRTRAARCVLRFEAASGDNDGCADDLVLRLVARRGS